MMEIGNSLSSVALSNGHGTILNSTFYTFIRLNKGWGLGLLAKDVFHNYAVLFVLSFSGLERKKARSKEIALHENHLICNIYIEYGILGELEGPQISTNQKQKNSAFLLMIG